MSDLLQELSAAFIQLIIGGSPGIANAAFPCDDLKPYASVQVLSATGGSFVITVTLGIVAVGTLVAEHVADLRIASCNFPGASAGDHGKLQIQTKLLAGSNDVICVRFLHSRILNGNAVAAPANLVSPGLLEIKICLGMLFLDHIDQLFTVGITAVVRSLVGVCYGGAEMLLNGNNIPVLRVQTTFQGEILFDGSVLKACAVSLNKLIICFII